MNSILLYVATGDTYRSEARKSAQSARAYVGDTPIVLCTDFLDTAPMFDFVFTLQDPAFSFIDKINGLLRVDATNILFLDTDTRVCGDLNSAFRLLERFDLAAAHASWRFSPTLENGKVIDHAYRSDEIPASFVDFNTGVIAIRKSPKVVAFLESWLETYLDQLSRPGGKPANDQAAFAEAVWRSNLDVYVLPPEFNCRYDFPVFVGSDVRILHGKGPGSDQVAQSINAGNGARAYIPELRSTFDSRSYIFNPQARTTEE